MKAYTFLIALFAVFSGISFDNADAAITDTPESTTPLKKDLEEDRNTLFTKAIVAIDRDCDGNFEYVNNYAEFNVWDCQAQVEYAVNEAKANGWCYKITR